MSVELFSLNAGEVYHFSREVTYPNKATTDKATTHGE